MNLPEPECRYGYPWSQLEALLLRDELDGLGKWMRGQTGAICTGVDEDIPHGMVLYTWDVARYFAGLPVID